MTSSTSAIPMTTAPVGRTQNTNISAATPTAPIRNSFWCAQIPIADRPGGKSCQLAALADPAQASGEHRAGADRAH